MSIYRLDKLFAPQSVAVIGASDTPGRVGNILVRNLLDGGFSGRLHLVNPGHRTVADRPCLRDIQSLPEIPDLAIVATPARVVPTVVRELAEAGVRAACVLTGARDQGEGAPQRMKEDVIRLARPHGLRIVGPDCLGVLVPRLGLNASYVPTKPQAGDLALISQSSTIVTTMIDWANAHGVGFSAIASLGDKSDVDFGDLLDFFSLDYRTRAILLYVESIENPQKFMSAARAAARTKPVVVIRTGRSDRAVRRDSHAGALAGADAVYDAAFRRAGLVRVNHLGDLFDAAETLSRLKPFPGRRLAILSNGGAPANLAVDRLVEKDGTLADLSPATIAAIDAVAPACWSHANPVDLVADADGARYATALDAVLADPGVDAVLVMNSPTALADSTGCAQAIADAVTRYRGKSLRPKPVLAAFLHRDPKCREILDAARLPHYDTPHDGIDGFAHLVDYSASQVELTQTPPPLPADLEPDVDYARAVIAEALAKGQRRLTPVAVGAVLSAYRIPVASASLAETPQEAAGIARRLIGQGHSCVLKIQSHDIPHKSDVGGVRLNLTTPEAVEDAAWGMLARIRTLRPDARIDGVTVHPMMTRPGSTELIAGITDDPVFGPVVVFGRGGTAVEIINDKALALPPLDLATARDLIGRTRVAARLRGYRDRPAADLDAIALTLVKLAQLSADLPEIREVDLNPLIADEHGIMAVDARMEIAPAAPARAGCNPRFSVHPYPRQWESHEVLKDGTKVLVRPVKPEDEALYPDFFSEVTQEDLRLRFFAPVRDFSHAFIARLTQIDYARAIALLAIEEETGKMLGVVRLHADPNRETGEYAILLRSNLKGKGLGWMLMQRMITWARVEGLKKVKGQVLRENTTMLQMCARLGFSIAEDPDDQAIRIVTLPVAPPTEDDGRLAAAE
jgi:acetyltransferase